MEVLQTLSMDLKSQNYFHNKTTMCYTFFAVLTFFDGSNAMMAKIAPTNQGKGTNVRVVPLSASLLHTDGLKK